MIALASRLGFRVVFLGNPPLGARLYGAAWARLPLLGLLVEA